ncbi:hypothetical protein ACFLZV_04825 [Candidatus Margulisiibacteriota bacterium]
MQPLKNETQKAFPQIPDSKIDAYLKNLGSRYASYFLPEQIIDHFKIINDLTAKCPVKILFKQNSNDNLELTIIGFEYRSIFSILTGILASASFDIMGGEVFTYTPFENTDKVHNPRRFFRKGTHLKKEIQKRIIIDHFQGKITTVSSLRKWMNDLKQNINKVFLLLEENSPEANTKAKQITNIMVAKKLEQLRLKRPLKLYPVKIDIDNASPKYTSVKITSQDTPFFLHSLSTALAHQNISIEHIQITEKDNLVHDEFFVTNIYGKKIESAKDLERIKIAVLLIKQMTYFITYAANPSTAISRFSLLVNDTIKLSEPEKWWDFFSDPVVLQDIARVLGASDFIWDDFLSLHHEDLLAIFKPNVKFMYPYKTKKSVKEKFSSEIQAAKDFSDLKTVINKFIAQQIFLLDLDHILGNINLDVLSRRFTEAAEVIIEEIIKIIFHRLIRIYGKPQTIAGIETHYAVFGLGKFGGAQIGYGSDIELMFVYSDKGFTNGKQKISNSEFFNTLIKEVCKIFEPPYNKFFELDLRLRPFGKDGPLAVSLESFSGYYGRQGQAHLYELLSLVRLRYITGDKKFGKNIERLRNTFVFSAPELDFTKLWELRKKQFKTFLSITPNVKYSAGGLVDIEYTIQSLQVLYGTKHKDLRMPNIKEALTNLEKRGILKSDEFARLFSAYDFFSKLVNGLRMLRYSAKDLCLPEAGSEEYEYLARRIGYSQEEMINPSQKLQLDFDMHSAIVRSFMESHFQDIALPSKKTGNIADLILGKSLEPEIQLKILTKKGFHNPQRAYLNLKKMAGRLDKSSDVIFARAAVLACNFISQKPDPDKILNNWERFTEAITNPLEHYQTTLKQPMRFEILFDIFSASQFLTELLISCPEFFEHISNTEQLYTKRNRLILLEELEIFKNSNIQNPDWLKQIRNFRKQELLRIAIRDISLQVPLKDITKELSLLASIIIGATLTSIWENLKKDKNLKAIIPALEDNFCMLALGKLGGSELNYSSDIDLLALYDDKIFSQIKLNKTEIEKIYSDVIKLANQDLSKHIDIGKAYRVDLTLRPYGRAGKLVFSLNELLEYYQSSAGVWELQALIKINPVAGSWPLGFELIWQVRNNLYKNIKPEKVINSIYNLRKKSIDMQKIKNIPGTDIKNCQGGIRDIEFITQGLQLIKAIKGSTFLLSQNTLFSLNLLKKAGVLPPDTASELSRFYTFFRRIEHFLQLMEDRRTHSIPENEQELDALAKKLLGNEAVGSDLNKALEKGFNYVSDAWKHLTGQI